MNAHPVKIAILGPESTGKSTLAEELASFFDTVWVPEYARHYLPALDHPYTEEDVLHCVKGQRELESKMIRNAKNKIFFDTEMINFKIWLLDKYGFSPAWITSDLNDRYDFYLLTFPDLPFVKDSLRENPDRRDYFFNLYREEIELTGKPYAIVSGQGSRRLQTAIEAVNRITPA